MSSLAVVVLYSLNLGERIVSAVKLADSEEEAQEELQRMVGALAMGNADRDVEIKAGPKHATIKVRVSGVEVCNYMLSIENTVKISQEASHAHHD